MGTETGARDRKKTEVRSRITDATIELFLERGVQHTLIDDITAAAGVSRRTFFNYFASKQDVFTEWFHLQGEHLAEGVSSRPKDEAVWDSLHSAYRAMRQTFGGDHLRIIKLRHLLQQEPTLLAKKFECLITTHEKLTPVIEQRIGPMKQRALAAKVLVQAASGAYNSACADWEAAPQGKSFEYVLKQAFAIGKPLIATQVTSK